MTSVSVIIPIKKYVGTAKTRPDSFTPRRLTMVMNAIIASAISTRQGSNPGNAEVIWATPEATLTETVRM